MFFIWSVIFMLFLIDIKFVSCDVKYIAVYQDSIRECEDQDEQGIDFSKAVLVQESGSDGYLTGEVTIKEDIHEGAQIKADITHEVDGSHEYVCGVVGDLCEELENPDTPWYPIFRGMGITECPIKKGKYEMDKVELDVSNFEEYLNSDYCGDYIGTFSVLDVPEDDGSLDPGSLPVPRVISCHTMAATVLEVMEDE